MNRTITVNTNARKVYFKIGTAPVDKRAELWNQIFETKQPNRSDVELGLINALDLIDFRTLGELHISPATIEKWIKMPSVSYSIKKQLINKKIFF